MNTKKAKKLFKPGTLFTVVGSNRVVGMSLGYKKPNEINSFNLINIVTGEFIGSCDGKCRLATKREQAWYWAALSAKFNKDE